LHHHIEFDSIRLMGFTGNAGSVRNVRGMAGLTRYLHHVGVVVPSERHASDLIAFLGLEERYRGYVERWQVLCIFTEGHGGSPVEFVVPCGDFLKDFNKGIGGLHHVAFAVDSLSAVHEYLRTRGMSLVEDKPVKGAGPFLCNFLSPIYTRGLTVEFIEEIKDT
jgi:methylmalonyl-CoA/ethylmalonyl-CoA epimerase